MELFETEKKEIETNLANPDFYQDHAKSSKAGKRYQALQEMIPKLLAKWEARQSELDELLSGLS